MQKIEDSNQSGAVVRSGMLVKEKRRELAEKNEDANVKTDSRVSLKE